MLQMCVGMFIEVCHEDFSWEPYMTALGQGRQKAQMNTVKQPAWLAVDQKADNVQAGILSQPFSVGSLIGDSLKVV